LVVKVDRLVNATIYEEDSENKILWKINKELPKKWTTAGAQVREKMGLTEKAEDNKAFADRQGMFT